MNRKKRSQLLQQIGNDLARGEEDTALRKVALAENQTLHEDNAELRTQLEDAVADNARLRDAVASLEREQPMIQPSVLRAVFKAGYAFHTYGSQDETEVVVKFTGDPDYGKRFVHEHGDIAFSKAVDFVWKSMVKTSETFTGTDK